MASSSLPNDEPMISAAGGSDPPPSPERRALMAKICAKNTRPEIPVRRLLHGLGYRYRLHRRDLPGTPDLVFVRRRKIV